MTNDDPPAAGDHVEEALELMLRRTLVGHGQPPAGLPDLEGALRGKLKRRRTPGWAPLAAAIGVLVLVAGVVGAVRLGTTDRDAAPRPATRVSSSAATTGGDTSGRATKLTLTAVQAVQPYRTAPAVYPVPNAATPKNASSCTPQTLSMNPVHAYSGPPNIQVGTNPATYFTVIGRGIGLVPCTLDQHGLEMVVRDARGRIVSQGAMTTANIEPGAYVSPGQIVLLQGSWQYACSPASGPLTATVTAFTPTGVSDNWTLAGTIPAPGVMTPCEGGGGPRLFAVSQGDPGSVLTLGPQVATPASVASGASFAAMLTLTNETSTAVPLTACPDISVLTVGPQYAVDQMSATFRISCPPGVTLAPGESVSVNLPMRAPALSMPALRQVIIDWARDAQTNGAASTTTYAVTVDRAAPSKISIPTARPTPSSAITLTTS